MANFIYDIEKRLEDIPKNKKYLNKYFFLAEKNGYKLINQGHLLLSNKFPRYIREFIREHQEVIFIPNAKSWMKDGAVLRAIKDKKFMVMGKTDVPYRYWDLDIKYGEPVVIVEGAIDCDVMREIYKPTVGLLTSGASDKYVDALSLLTNKVILLYDNDKTGERLTRVDSEKFRKAKFHVEVMKQYSKNKDTGDIIDLELQMKSHLATQSRTYYKATLDIILNKMSMK